MSGVTGVEQKSERAFGEPNNVLIQAPAVLEQRAIAPFLIRTNNAQIELEKGGKIDTWQMTDPNLPPPRFTGLPAASRQRAWISVQSWLVLSAFPSECDQRIRLRPIVRTAPSDLVKRSHPRPDGGS